MDNKYLWGRKMNNDELIKVIKIILDNYYETYDEKRELYQFIVANNTIDIISELIEKENEK